MCRSFVANWLITNYTSFKIYMHTLHCDRTPIYYICWVENKLFLRLKANENMIRVVIILSRRGYV